MRIFRFSSQGEVKKIMREIGVDPCGINVMLPKASAFLIRLNALNYAAANILKQETLSLGADTAVARGALTGKTPKTDALIIARLSQLSLLADKLKHQPFGLDKLGQELTENIKNFAKDNFKLSLRNCSLDLGKKTHIMGIINLTPDSSSGDGLYNNPDLALKKAEEMADNGADIIDLGGESSRPGAKSVPIKEELRRVIPVIKLLKKKIKVPLSIDTTKAQVAKEALETGAQMINDISGLRNKQMIKVAAKYRAAVVIMHMLGKPANMQKIIAYRSLIEDIAGYLKKSIELAQTGGIAADKIIIDPGIGFGKKPEHNLEIIRQLADFKVLGKPILIGPSRKSFIGKVLGIGLEERINGTLAACVMASQRGANILRVHDVREVSQCLKMANAIEKNVYA